MRVAWDDVDALTQMGERGRQRVAALSWDAVVAELLGAAGLRA
jgi:hypothetical protein